MSTACRLYHALESCFRLCNSTIDEHNSRRNRRKKKKKILRDHAVTWCKAPDKLFDTASRTWIKRRVVCGKSSLLSSEDLQPDTCLCGVDSLSIRCLTTPFSSVVSNSPPPVCFAPAGNRFERKNSRSFVACSRGAGWCYCPQQRRQVEFGLTSTAGLAGCFSDKFTRQARQNSFRDWINDDEREDFTRNSSSW